MSKITISAVIAIVNLILKSIRYVLNLIDVISDLLDDGSVNSSNEATKFSEFRQKVLNFLDELGSFIDEYSLKSSDND